MTLDQWLTTNIKDRVYDHSVDFSVTIKKSVANILGFNLAVRETIDCLVSEGRTLYLGVSGGTDSEYVLGKFVHHKAPFIPVIVHTDCSEEEYTVASDLCRKYDIKPTVIKLTTAEYIKIYKTKILGILNGVGHYGPPSYTVARYAADHDGIYVKSEHLISETIDGKMIVGANEWDFYNDALHDYDVTRYFFFHTPDITYSMISAMSGDDSQRFKCKLYEIPYRDKIRPVLDPILLSYISQLKQNRSFKPRWDYILGDKHEFLKDSFPLIHHLE
jgi:hypothetical protein